MSKNNPSENAVTKQSMSKNAKIVLAVILLLAVAAAAIGAYFLWGPPAQKRAEEARRQQAVLATAQAQPVPGEVAEEYVTEGSEEAAEAPTETMTEEVAEEPVEAVEEAVEEPDGFVTITFTVVHGDGSQTEYTLTTDAVTLREALEQKGLIAGTESDWGLYVLTVDGETADESLQQWWCLTKDGEMSMTGVDDTVIADGDHYEFTLTTGW